MTLEERYNQAATSTYVGKVRTLQGADSTEEDGVNFMNGEGFVGTPPAPDSVQTEFKRNKAGAFKYGGDGKVPGSAEGEPEDTYKLSRWLQKGLDKGDTYTANNRFTVLNDVRNRGTLLQRYNWLQESNKFIGKLSGLPKGRVEGGATGPLPSGING